MNRHYTKRSTYPERQAQESIPEITVLRHHVDSQGDRIRFRATLDVCGTSVTIGVTFIFSPRREQAALLKNDLKLNNKKPLRQAA
jgi:hypothetical protein